MKRILSVAAMTTVTAIAILTNVTPPQPTLAQEATPPTLTSPEATADARVKRVLNALGLHYQEDEKGNFQVYFEFENGRSQVAHIFSSTSSAGSRNIRYIFSPAHTVDGTFSAQIANQLLLDNTNRHVGLWQLVETDGRSIALYTARVDADADTEEFGMALAAVLTVSDEMELALNGGDRF